MSFKKFLGLESGDKVPDEKTIWLFRENITKSGVVEVSFSQFTKFLEEKNLLFNEGKLVDARWTKKDGEKYFGYKNHAKVDSRSKFIKKYAVTDASVHDSHPLDNLLDKSDKGQPLYADSAYTEEKQRKVIRKYRLKNKVHEMRSIHEYE